MVVRLRPGASVPQRQSELEGIARRNEQDHTSEMPEYKGWKLSAVQLARSTNPLLRTAAGVLLAAVAAVMLIACVNVANLILARAARRSREVAIRRAIGATRMHLLSQYFTEGLLLSACACGLGVLIAFWGLDVLLALLPKQIDILPPGVEVAINARVLAFIAAIVLGTAMIFGIVPALQRQREGLTAALHEGARSSTSPAARRFTNTLVVSEIALSLLLLIATGLAIRSYARLASVDPGFQPDNVLIMRMTLPVNKYKPPQITAFFKQLQERVSQLPGVKSAGAANQLPPIGFSSAQFQSEGRAPDQTTRADLTVASTGFIRAIGVPLQKGRLFDAADDTVESQPVVIVNEQLAKAMFPNEDPIGKRVRLARNDKAPWNTIIGVVGTARNRGLDKEPQPEVYIPLAKDMGQWNQLWLAVRTEGDPQSMLAAVREQVRAIDPDQPVYLAMEMREAVDLTTLPRRAAAWLLAVFGALAMLLAIVGLYGVIAYTVARRTQEIGIRVALGASRSEILRLVLRNGMALAFAGIAIGTAAGAVLASFAGKVLYGVSAYDLVAFTVAPALLLLTTLLASYLPALRATKVDPVVALRYD